MGFFLIGANFYRKYPRRIHWLVATGVTYGVWGFVVQRYAKFATNWENTPGFSEEYRAQLQHFHRQSATHYKEVVMRNRAIADREMRAKAAAYLTETGYGNSESA